MTAASASPFPRHEPTSRSEADAALATLQERSAAWAALSLDDRIEYLRSILRGTMADAPALVADTCAAKGISGAQAGEEWGANILTQARTLHLLIDTLEGIRRTGRVPLRDSAVRTRPDGQLTVRVFPVDAYDLVMYQGATADIWVDPNVGRADFDRHLGSFYAKEEIPPARVSLVLGAGNVNSIAPLDVVHKMFVEGSTVVLKVARVNEYIGPYVERAFADLIADGFLRVVYGGGPDIGEYACRHPAVGQVHLTGSVETGRSLIWGPEPEAAGRRAAGEPLLDKPFTGELGNVGPVIVVPGQWSERALRLRAEDVATQIVQNDGFNCNACRVLVLAEGWLQRERFLDHLRRVLASRPPRRAFHPGSEDDYDRYLAAHDGAEVLGERRPGVLPPALVPGVDPAGDHLAFHEEGFIPLTVVTALPAGSPAEFLERAVAFCNERLAGTLSATLIVDGPTSGELGPALDRALAGLRYGSVGVNIWGGISFALGSTTWGAYPGHTLEDIGSGMGVVRNARLIDRPQKTVLRAPFTLLLKPPWFVTHRNAHRVLSRSAVLAADPHWWRLPGIGFWDLLS
jgi:acyl-CoA reductase-like NAD-dependent aldehyde dehydrogenase